MVRDGGRGMIHQVSAGPYTVRGISLAGVYTSLLVPELHVLLDVGVPLRSFATAERIFLSHTHGDHAGGLIPLLGIRELVGKARPRVYLPAEAERDVCDLLALASRTHHSVTDAELVPLMPNQ